MKAKEIKEIKEEKPDQKIIWNHAITVASGFIQKSSKTDLQSQIDFIEWMSINFIRTPIFIAIINSLKELQSIKRTTIYKKLK